IETNRYRYIDGDKWQISHFLDHITIRGLFLLFMFLLVLSGSKNSMMVKMKCHFLKSIFFYCHKMLYIILEHEPCTDHDSSIIEKYDIRGFVINQFYFQIVPLRVLGTLYLNQYKPCTSNKALLKILSKLRGPKLHALFNQMV
ncbi:hypothetical protein ACJX0J_040056, partial [Zea mays]